ncbi:MAG: anhydro-N-acetylmuramic acid kinase [Proteobacteria bacterium]|nr:anhydro-N-acetylmuramic acid kinase [Pseudomonadota bacterium]
MANDAALYLGLISGTSADGIDVALASFEAAPRLRAALTHPYPDGLRRRILDLAQGDGRIALDELGALDVEIARSFADAANALLQREGVAATEITALGSHGQTVRHRPLQKPPFTLQLGDPGAIAEGTGITTIADFRRRDIAAGGQGAPLTPAFHAAMLAHDGVDRVVLNLGGIANITVLDGDRLRGFDTGPASCLLDAWAHEHLGEAFDRDGAFAARGRVDSTLLARLLADPYFAAPPPKSTGREVFHLGWLGQHLGADPPSPQDVQATLVELTARSVAAAVRAQAPRAREVLVCGGGTHNPVLMRAIAVALAPVTVASTATRDIDPDYVEAMAFAWFARERLARRAPENAWTVTGARGPRVLGGIYFGA